MHEKIILMKTYSLCVFLTLDSLVFNISYRTEKKDRDNQKTHTEEIIFTFYHKIHLSTHLVPLLYLGGAGAYFK